MPKVAIVIDESGSMSQEWVDLFTVGMKISSIALFKEQMGFEKRNLDILSIKYDKVYFFTDQIIGFTPPKNVIVISVLEKAFFEENLKCKKCLQLEKDEFLLEEL